MTIFSQRIMQLYRQVSFGVALSFACGSLHAEKGRENVSAAQKLVGHLATVAKELERRPAVALSPAKLRDTYLIDIAENGKKEVIAVGVHGGILHSRNGNEWRQMSVPTDVTFTAIKFDALGGGWLGGHEGTIMHLPAGAKEWQLVRTDPEFDGPILDFIFLDQQIGIALSSGGRIFRTTDGGKNWTVAEIVTEDFFNPHLFGATLTSPNIAFVVGERGTVFRSNDLGASWTELPSPFIGSLFGIVGFVDGSLLAYGITGHAFYSADNGATWTTIDTGVKDSLFAHAWEGDNVLLFGADGVALRVTPGMSRMPTVERLDKVGRFSISSVTRGANGQFLAASSHGIQKLELIPEK